MLTLIKNIECFCPEYIGKKDILIAFDKIYRILDAGQINCSLISNTIDCDGLLAFPGLIDQHIHIIGGGGENGFNSRICEINSDDIINAGVTTVVGVLGFDGFTRSLNDLLAKSRALEEQGITAFIYTGSYAVPTETITDNVTTDIVLIDKVIGTGEIAISDYRSSLTGIDELIKLSSETLTGGMLSSKAGVVHIHVGEGKEGLKPIFETLEKSNLPISMFVPTHLNRTRKLFNDAISYLNSGGNIDLTAGESIGLCVPDALRELFDKNVELNRVTVSSDANGSISGGGVGQIQTLFNDIKSSIINKNVPVEKAFSTVTENAAKILKLYPKKGILSEESDADILITDKDYNIKKLFAMGKLLLNKEDS